MGELGVKVGDKFYFLYKGYSLQYGKAKEGSVAKHDDGTPMRYRPVDKREFGETCWPVSWIAQGRREDRYTKEYAFHFGLSDSKPEGYAWRDLPSAMKED